MQPLLITFFLLATPAVDDDEIVIEEPSSAQTLTADDGDEIVLEDEPETPPKASSLGDEIVLEDEMAQSPPELTKPAFKPSTLVLSSLETALALDTVHDPSTLGAPEDVIESWGLLRLQLRHRLAPGRSWRVGARARLWGGWDHPDEGGQSKTVLLTELTEVRYDHRFGQDLVFQLGLQKVDWSVTDGMGPSVMFAARDLRFGLAGEPEDLSLPVEAVVARYTLNYTHDVHLDFAFVPRDRPLEIRLWGTDWGVASPDQSANLPIGDISWLFDRSVEDEWQNNLFYFAKPEFTPEDFSGALRLRGRLYGAEIGVWGFYGFDTFPELKMDPDLAAVLTLMTTMGTTPLLEQFTPETIAALERFQTKMAEARALGDGSSLITSVFHRLAQLGAQVRRSYGSFVFALESAWTPRFLGGRTLFSPLMEPLPGLATLHTALQIEYQSPPRLIAVLGISDFTVFDVANKPLMLLDTSSLTADGRLDRPFDPDASHLVTINMALKSQYKERLEWVVAGVIHPVDQDWLIMPSVAWLVDEEREQLRLSGEFFGGPSGSMFGGYGHNDRVVLSYKRSF